MPTQKNIFKAISYDKCIRVKQDETSKAPRLIRYDDLQHFSFVKNHLPGRTRSAHILYDEMPANGQTGRFGGTKGKGAVAIAPGDVDVGGAAGKVLLADAIIIIEREITVGARIDAEGSGSRDRFGAVLADGVEWNDGSCANVDGHDR